MVNTTALAIIQPEELDTMQRAARLLAVSNYFDGKGDNPQAIAMLATKIMAGREMGFGPFASANGIHIIQGKPTVGANLMAAAVRAHPRYDYRVKELTDTVCELEFFDNGKVAGPSRFTIQDAERAELTTGKNAHTWKKYARNMLFARAMSNGVRFFAPDIFSGNAVYVPEELDVAVDGDGSVIESTYVVTQPSPDVEFYKPTGATQQAQNSDYDIVTPEDAQDGHNAHLAPLYAHLIDKLEGDCLERANRARRIHAQSRGGASPEQYRFLAGTIDDLVRQVGGHKAVLEVFVGRAVSSANPPGTQLAGKLLDALLETRTEEVEGVKVTVPNPTYSPEAVSCVHAIYRLIREQDGQASLFDAAAAQPAQPVAK